MVVWNHPAGIVQTAFATGPCAAREVIARTDDWARPRTAWRSAGASINRRSNGLVAVPRCRSNSVVSQARLVQRTLCIEQRQHRRSSFESGGHRNAIPSLPRKSIPQSHQIARTIFRVRASRPHACPTWSARDRSRRSGFFGSPGKSWNAHSISPKRMSYSSDRISSGLARAGRVDDLADHVEPRPCPQTPNDRIRWRTSRSHLWADAGGRTRRPCHRTSKPPAARRSPAPCRP
jgi:hypothetical protein